MFSRAYKQTVIQMTTHWRIIVKTSFDSILCVGVSDCSVVESSSTLSNTVSTLFLWLISLVFKSRD